MELTTQWSDGTTAVSPKPMPSRGSGGRARPGSGVAGRLVMNSSEILSCEVPEGSNDSTAICTKPQAVTLTVSQAGKHTETNSKTNHRDKQTSKSSGQLQTYKHTDTHTVTGADYLFFFLNIRIGERGIHVMCLSAFNKNSFHHLVKHRGASRGSMDRCIEHRSQVPRGPGREAALALQ